MNKITLSLLIFASLFVTACGNNENKTKVNSEVYENEEVYTKDTYLIETASDVREIRSLQEKLKNQLAEENEPFIIISTLMDMSIASTDRSYKLTGTESVEFDTIAQDLKTIQAYVDEQYEFFSDQKELDKLKLNETITHLEGIIGKLETDFDSVY